MVSGAGRTSLPATSKVPLFGSFLDPFVGGCPSHCKSAPFWSLFGSFLAPLLQRLLLCSESAPFWAFFGSFTNSRIGATDKKQISEVGKQAKALRKAELSKVITSIHLQLADHGLTVADLAKGRVTKAKATMAATQNVMQAPQNCSCAADLPTASRPAT